MVAGTPQLKLETGTTDATANYASGSSTPILTFTYTVQAGNTSGDLDYESASALTAPSGATIKDAAGNAAVLTLPAPGASGSLGFSKAIVIDTTASAVTGVSSTKDNGTYGEGAVIPVTVTFIENVTVTGVPQLTLATGGTGAVAGYSSGTGTTTLTFTYTVAPGQASADLDYAGTTMLALPSGATIKDAAGNAADLTLAAPGASNSLGANKNIIVETTPPTVTNVTSTNADVPHLTNASIAITITFSENVTVNGIPQLLLETGVTDAVASYASGSGSATLTFTFIVAAANTTTDLDYGSTSALTLPLGVAIKDAAGNAATLALPAPGGAGSLGANKAIVINT